MAARSSRGSCGCEPGCSGATTLLWSTLRLDRFRNPSGTRQNPRPMLSIKARGDCSAWMQSLVARSTGVGPAFEDVLHGFAEIIETEADPVIIESSLLRLVRQLARRPGSSLLPDHPRPSVAMSAPTLTARNPIMQRACRAFLGLERPIGPGNPLACGRSVCGRLRIRPRADLPLRDDVIRRLTTLCTMAAGAFESLGRQAACCGDDDAVQSDSDCDQAAANDAWAVHPIRPSVLVQDATFLNAVLPFALNQAKRHRESLSLLCVAIDRLSSIQDLMGRAEVDRLVQHVGQTVSSLIRKSDIVARLDDDRIVAVLPRAPVAAPSTSPTTSAGPSLKCARTDLIHPVSPSRSAWRRSRRVPPRLLALRRSRRSLSSAAKKQGRARAVLAPTLPTPTPVRRPLACLSYQAFGRVLAA